MFKIFKIKGNSMLPLIKSGDFILCSRLKKIAINRLVVITHPDYKILIKRVVSIKTNGDFLVAGDNPDSINSQQMGWFCAQQFIGSVILHIKQSI